MTFREKSAWISLITLVVVYGYYYLHLAASDTHAGVLLAQSVIVLIIVEAVLTSAVAMHQPKQAQAPADERERLVGLKAARAGFYVLTIAALGVCAAMAAGLAAPAAAASLVFLAVVVGEAARNLGYIAYARARA